MINLKLPSGNVFKIIFVFIVLISLLFSQVNPYDSGGELIREQAAYDVTHYDLNLVVEPENKFISGSLTVTASALDTISWLVMDLDTKLSIDYIKVNGFNQDFERQSSRLWIKLPEFANIGDTIKATIHYHGNPLIADNPPWEGGFNWSSANDGSYWIGVSCEGEGADVWWPCKDHPSDEPDSMALHFTVPKPYFCASNGKLVNINDNNDGAQTFNWNVSTPINNYNVTVNIALYEEITGEYQSIAGDTIDLFFWVLPDDKSKAEILFPEISRQLGFFEQYFGPYQFRTDKMGYVHTAYAGMEHQTVISYGEYFGSIFTMNEYGFDYILLHETAHEWWGNLITAKDWKDAWIHEGFATYAEAMYVEYLHGIDRYHDYVADWYKGGSIPIASRESKTKNEGFAANIYHGGALVLHSLRYLLGDATFYALLRQMLYPDLDLENDNSGTDCRLVTTDEFIALAEQLSGRELDWFFNLYVYDTELPVLLYYLKDGKLLLKWKVDSVSDFNMPVVVKFNNQENKIEMSNGLGEIEVGSNSYVIDPSKWILKEGLHEDSALDTTTNEADIVSFKLYNNYPNPFNPNTTIVYSIPNESAVTITVYDMLGKEINQLISQKQQSGKHSVQWNGVDHNGNTASAGIYFYQIQAGDFIQTKKMVLLK